MHWKNKNSLILGKVRQWNQPPEEIQKILQCAQPLTRFWDVQPSSSSQVLIQRRPYHSNQPSCRRVGLDSTPRDLSRALRSDHLSRQKKRRENTRSPSHVLGSTSKAVNGPCYIKMVGIPANYRCGGGPWQRVLANGREPDETPGPKVSG